LVVCPSQLSSGRSDVAAGETAVDDPLVLQRHQLKPP
jgi:hypothetical protein